MLQPACCHLQPEVQSHSMGQSMFAAPMQANAASQQAAEYQHISAGALQPGLLLGLPFTLQPKSRTAPPLHALGCH